MQAFRPLLLTALCLAALAAVLILTDRPAQACCPRPPEIISNIDEFTTEADRALEENPGDPDQLYACARAHIYAAVQRSQEGRFNLYGDLNEYFAPVTADSYLSPAQATSHYRRAMDLLARLEAVAPDRSDLYIARAYLVEHCCRDLDLLPADLSPLAPADAARWQTTINNLAQPDAGARQRAVASLTDARATILPVLRANLDNPTLAIRTPVRELVQGFWRDEALSNYRHAFDLYTAAARAESGFDRLEFAQERILCGDASVRLIRLHTATAEETGFIRHYQKLHKKLARQVEQQIQVEPCEVEN